MITPIKWDLVATSSLSTVNSKPIICDSSLKWVQHKSCGRIFVQHLVI